MRITRIARTVCCAGGQTRRNMALHELRQSFERTPTTRLTSLFEWDKRFNTKCFQEEIHPKFSHMLKKHLAEEEAKLSQFFGSEEYNAKIATVETVVDLCSPTDTHSGENILLAADFLVLYLGIKAFAVRNRQTPDFVQKVVAVLSSVLKGDKHDGGDLGEDKAKMQALLDWAQSFRSQLKRRVELESSAGSSSQLEHFYQSLNVALQATVQEGGKITVPQLIFFSNYSNAPWF